MPAVVLTPIAAIIILKPIRYAGLRNASDEEFPVNDTLADL